MPDLTRNAVDVLPEGRLAEQLKLDRPLRVKLGIDPTTPDIHLGHTVVLGKLAEFQAAGHTVVLIVGDFTARVGDPSGRSASRPVPTPEEIEANATTYQEQAYKILDPAKTEVRRNGEWLDMNLADLLRLMGTTTVARLLERDDFQNRMAENAPIAGHELLYPLMQGYDSVAIDADIELGGTDQKFNLLFGRDVQSAYGKPQQSVMTLPILVGLDGVQKMSKSLGNYVGVTDPPAEMFGKLMSIPDEAMDEYFRLLLPAIEKPEGEPVRQKRFLAGRIVDRFHGEGAGVEAEQAFDKVFVQHAVPDDIPLVDLSEYVTEGDGEVHLPRLIAGAFGMSTSEGRRLLAGGGVKIDGDPISAITLDVAAAALAGRVIQVGKRRFAKLSDLD
ncbi:MAG: tyrosine--tRNA ligase [Solirubrobacterales bacterium]